VTGNALSLQGALQGRIRTYYVVHVIPGALPKKR